MIRNCNDVITIEDVTNYWDYLDKIRLGDKDRQLVACGQGTDSNGYNELKDKYEKYYSVYPEEDVAKAMCECCKEKNKGFFASGLAGSLNQWEQYYECLEKKGFKKKH